jgi:undecaprenyl-phosphate 4-deoxy-4-formamido-L-arabinose transferase
MTSQTHPAAPAQAASLTQTPMHAAPPRLSVVIPVYNEEAVLPLLLARLYPALDALATPYEVIFVNDGSRDRSAALLADAWRSRPDVTRVVLFRANFGQHAAIMAGFSQVRGERIVTLDADLQNPPEEIATLMVQMDQGHDYVGTIRASRNDGWWRAAASRLANRVRERTTRIRITDQGCMLRAYSRPIVDAIVHSREIATFIPALAYTFSHRPTEVTVAFDDRAAGESKYSLGKLIRLNFDLITAFSTVPLQAFSIFGMLMSVAAILSYVGLLVWRVVHGDLEGGLRGLIDRDILGFILLGFVLFGIGLLGEYVGRIYQQVRERPRYLIEAILEGPTDAQPASPLTRSANRGGPA